MPLTALILSPQPLDAELSDTVLWRQNVERYIAASADEARTVASGGRPDILIVDERISNAATVVAQLRQDPLTRNVSIVALARGDFDPSEVALIEAGANAILRLPPGPEWDDRLVRLIHVPLRRATRFEMALQIELAIRAVRPHLSRDRPEPERQRHARGVDPAAAHRRRRPVRVLLPPHRGRRLRLGDGGARVPAPHQFGVELTHVEGDGRVRIRQFVESDGP